MTARIELTLDQQLDRLARVPTLLVASDYDGTLAPIVEDPSDARPHRETVAALRSLATLADTHVAVVSGRSLRDLAALSRLPQEIHLVGSHGSEYDIGFVSDLTPEQVGLRQQVVAELDAAVGDRPGFTLEFKPAGVALHYRMAAEADAEAVVDRVEAGIARAPGVTVKRGKKVLELTVVSSSKGQAIERLRHEVGADAVLFLGDDVTDEDAFSVLHGPDVAVKVGPGDTAAPHRITDTVEVSRLLARLCEDRTRWLAGAGAPPIERHSLLSDRRTMALVTPGARISWLCLPSVDSGSVFAELLGGPTAGYFAVQPVGGGEPISQRYLPDTMVLETRWSDLMVLDYLDSSLVRPDDLPGSTLVRVLEGRGAAEIAFVPRPDYGRAPALLGTTDDGLVVSGVATPLRLVSPGVEWRIERDGTGESAHAVVDLQRGPIVLELRAGTDCHIEGFDETDRRSATEEVWRSWVEGLELPAFGGRRIKRSALALKALCHEPTGAILAAATTSLPEEIGGVRNWDYRYCWPRDASMTAAALVELGSYSEAVALLDWLCARLDHLPGPEQLRPVYPVHGDNPIPEAVIPTLSGYAGSRPVRIGNAAENQVQLDVFGPVADLVLELVRRGFEITDEHWRVVWAMGHAVVSRWREPDHGIWEERRPQRHHVHSKVMCWMAIDRAIQIADRTGRIVSGDWRVLRHVIASEVLEYGWNEDEAAFTIAYGDSELDAASLWVGLSGLLPPDDARFVGTVRAVERGLRDGPIVYRYRLDDGLPGTEGGFVIASTWLIEAYALMGQLHDAEVLFERVMDLAGPTGMLSEQYDPADERMLGNHPQAYSHLGVIRAALAIERARAARAAD